MNAILSVPSAPDTLYFRIVGMTCDACVRHVTRAVEGLSGVREVTVDLETASARVLVETGRVQVEDLVLAVRHAGYAALLSSPEEAHRREPRVAAARGCGCCRPSRASV